MDELERKSLTPELKADGPEGTVTARFATLNVIDKDGDVTLPGAFGEQNVRLSAWGHKWHELPMGKGSIREDGDQALFEGAFFLDTSGGQDTYP